MRHHDIREGLGRMFSNLPEIGGERRCSRSASFRSFFSPFGRGDLLAEAVEVTGAQRPAFLADNTRFRRCCSNPTRVATEVLPTSRLRSGNSAPYAAPAS